MPLKKRARSPFGALVVVGGQIVGEGTSRVVELQDLTAHAEVMALRATGAALGRHLSPGGLSWSRAGTDWTGGRVTAQSERPDGPDEQRCDWSVGAGLSDPVSILRRQSQAFDPGRLQA